MLVKRDVHVKQRARRFKVPLFSEIPLLFSVMKMGILKDLSSLDCQHLPLVVL